MTENTKLSPIISEAIRNQGQEKGVDFCLSQFPTSAPVEIDQPSMMYFKSLADAV